jgi:hypothetical protein
LAVGGDLTRRIEVLAIGSSGVAVLIDAATIAARHMGGSVQFGDISGWVGGIGSLLAAIAAVGIAINTNARQDRRENVERAQAEARAVRRARRVYVSGDR